MDFADFFEQYREITDSDFEVDNGGIGGKLSRRIEIRQDPLFLLHSTALSPERADRPSKPLQSKGITITEKDCIFCPERIFQITPKPRKIHDRLFSFEDSGVKQQVITIPNLYPFAKPHWVTVFSHHKPDLRNLTYADLVNYFESGYEIAAEIKQDPSGPNGFWDITNWGELAGASQPHPHRQIGGIRTKMITTSDLELAAYQESKKRLGTTDPFDFYFSLIRDSDLFGWEDDYLFIYSPFAPKMSDQLDMILKPSRIKNRNIRTILDLEKGEREHIARCMLGVFHLLREKRGVTDLNVILHQQRFGQEDNYRINWHILPRNKSLWGGMEMYNHYVVDVYPETTAAAVREHYHTSRRR